ncbi:MAG TPA: mannose-1-phosphate guanylyltransferase [Levilinea sp.]|nr:mannose-1-phosphate guanylyltransferase [Levilinea sp.]
MHENYYAVIMAGGGGTRLWPLSNRQRPKQMLTLGRERTLFQMAVDRLRGVFPLDRILVVTVDVQAREYQKQYPEIPETNYLIEPMPRGTAAVVGLASAALLARDPQATMAILTADHMIENEQRFRDYLEAAMETAHEGYLVTLGIEPAYPATGYGYIQRGEMLRDDTGRLAYRVQRFREKPNFELAEKMVEGGDHYWNSGMFIWRADRIMDAFQQHMPELYTNLMDIREAWDTGRHTGVIERIWPLIKPETIDYGIMEHAANVVVLPAIDIGWNDVGSWDSIFEIYPHDAHGNIVIGAQHLNLDSTRSLIVGDTSNRLIVTIGMEGIIVIDTGNALLICPRGESQRVKEAVARLKEQGMQKYQ